MENISVIISGIITIFSAGLFTVSIASYKKHKNVKLLFICLVFLVLLIKGIFLSLNLFYTEFTIFTSNSYIGIYDVAILILLFIATLKRQKNAK